MPLAPATPPLGCVNAAQPPAAASVSTAPTRWRSRPRESILAAHMPSIAEKTKRRFINQLTPGERVDSEVFLVHQKDLRTTTNGSLYIHIVLADRTGQLLARIWNANQAQYDAIPDGGFITVRGRTESYKGKLQLIVDGVRVAEPDTFEIGDFLPRTTGDIDAMWAEVLGILETIKNEPLAALVQAFVDDEPLAAGFCKAPAAVQFHHAFIGGLLEHTLCVLRLACRILGAKDDSDSLYPAVSRDLVLAGVFLHDIGKTAELTYKTSFKYSNAGQLVGHITQVAIWIDRKIAEVEQKTGKPFPQDIQDVLTHIVLSHHGTHEFGSPRLPACPEAFVVHHLDNIDAKVQMTLQGIEKAQDEEGDWTEYLRSIGSRVFKKDIMGIRGDRPAP